MISKYIHRLRLPLLTKVGSNYNFRCTICGDSQKSKIKKRGWILTDKGGRYYCHNCGANLPFHSFLKEYHPNVYFEYLKDWVTEKKGNETILTKVENKLVINKETLNLRKLSTLNSNHIAVKYFQERKLPKKWLSYLYYTDNFMKWIHSIIEDKFEEYPEIDKRIVIPYYSQNHKIIAVQGRSLYSTDLRYITIKFNENAKKVCGLERIDKTKTIFVTEGFFDSLFLPNSISMGGADLDFKYLDSVTNKKKLVFIFDNEPRNKEIVQRIENVIHKGYRVVLFPYKLQSLGKDINDMIKNGLTRKELYRIIKKNIFYGLEAKIRFKLWRKC